MEKKYNLLTKGLINNLKNCVLFIVIIFITSCKVNLKEKIIGNWYFIDKDDSYNELYFGQNLYSFCSEISGKGSEYEYKIFEDTLKQLQNQKVDHIIMIIKDLSDDTMKFLNENGYLNTLFRINLNIDPLKDLKDPDESYARIKHERFIEEFWERATIVKINYGIIDTINSKQDSIPNLINFEEDY